MNRRKMQVLITILFMFVPAILAAQSTEKIRNRKVVVTEVRVAPGETASMTDKRPGLIVFLAGNAAEFIPSSGKARRESVTRGGVFFQQAEERSIKNEGPSELRFVRVEFLTGGLDDTWGMSGLSPNYKMLMENRYARTYDIKISAQSFEPQHTHHDRVVICLSGARLEHILPNGEKQPSTLESGDVAWRLGATHIGHNMGQTDLWVIAVEPK